MTQLRAASACTISPGWALAVTQPRREDYAAEHCHQQGLEVIFPKYSEQVVRRGKVVERVAALFPSYLFVLILDAHCYARLRSTRGVSHVVPGSAGPAMCPPHEVAALRRRMGADGVVRFEPAAPPPVTVYLPAQVVQVADEAHYLFGQRGLVQGMTARGRVAVLFSMLQRTVRVELESSALVAA